MHRVGHEIGNPLTAIISLATILQRLAGPNEADTDTVKKNFEKTRAYATTIMEEAWRITLLNERLVLLLSDRDAADSICNIEKVIEKALYRLRNVGRYKDLKTDINLEVPAFLAHIDTAQFQSLIFELISNAYNAILELPEAERDFAAQVNVRQEAHGVVVSVSNPSAAPCQKTLEKLFEPLVKGNEQTNNAGIGLTVCWAIVERLGGQIELVETTEGSRCNFVVNVTLPITIDYQQGVSISGSNVPPSSIPSSDSLDWKQRAARLSGELAVLVIEDELTVSSAIEKILRLAFSPHVSFHCTTTVGDDIGGLLKKAADYDVILCDVNLPEVSGRHVLTMLNEQAPNLLPRFAFITGERLRGEVQTYLATTGRPCLLKPFESAQLIEFVLDIIESSRATSVSL